VTADVIDGAIDEAHRRAAISDRDLSTSMEHFARTVRSVCNQWALRVERWFAGGAGTPTLAVTKPDGTPGVLKIAEPGRLDVAARVMKAADGHGYARVLEWNAEVGALLTERLGDVLWADARTLNQQGPIIVSLLRDAWRVPLDRGRPFTGKAAGLLEILGDLGPRYGMAHQPAIVRAIRYAEELAASEQPEVVCHGDPHALNVLRRGAGWALIDPDGFVGERNYDVGVVLRDGCREITAAESAAPGSGTALLRRECQRLAELAGLDAGRIWRWAFVERVTTGLYLYWHGYDDEAHSFLATALMLS
jgi:streptomycin 6-kinase